MKKGIRSYHRGRVSFWKAFKSEWQQIRTDRAVVFSFVSLTLMVIVLYSLVYGNEVVIDVPIAVVDQDFSKMGRKYVAMLDASEKVSIVENSVDFEVAKNHFFAKRIRGIVLIPKNFERDIRMGKQAAISVYTDASNMVYYKAVLSSTALVNGYFSADIKVQKAIASGDDMTSINPINIVSNGLFNPSGGYGTYIIPIITALIFQLVIMMAIGVLGGTQREIQNNRNNIAMLQGKEIIPQLLGKSLLYGIISMVILAIQLGLIYTLFSFPFRTSLFNLYVFFIPYIMAIVFLAICITFLFKKREDAILFLALLSMPALMLSGLSFPSEGFSYFNNIIANLIPSTSGAMGFVKLTQMQAEFDEVLREWFKLWGLCILYFFIASLLSRYRLKR